MDFEEWEEEIVAFHLVCLLEYGYIEREERLFNHSLRITQDFKTLTCLFKQTYNYELPKTIVGK